MYAGFSFWIWGTVLVQVLTAIFHARGFFSSSKFTTDPDKKAAISFTLIYLFGAAVNWYFLKLGMPRETWHGLMLIQVITYGLIFALQFRFAFSPPIIITGLVFLLTAGTYFFGTN